VRSLVLHSAVGIYRSRLFMQSDCRIGITILSLFVEPVISRPNSRSLALKVLRLKNQLLLGLILSLRVINAPQIILARSDNRAIVSFSVSVLNLRHIKLTVRVDLPATRHVVSLLKSLCIRHICAIPGVSAGCLVSVSRVRLAPLSGLYHF